MIKIIEERVRKTKLGYKILFYGSMGVLWSLANIGYSFGILAWFALVPLLFLLRFETIKRATFFSSIFGFAFYITNLYWMANPFIQLFGLNSNIWMTILGGFLGTIIAILFSYYHGLSFSLAVFLSKYLSPKKGERFYLFFPFIMTAVDYFFPKMWHDQIGYSQYIFVSFSQIADIFGVPIITLIVLLCNASIIMIVENVFFRRTLHRSIIGFVGIITLVIICSIYGVLRMDNIALKCQECDTAKIAVIQGNFTGLDKKDKVKRSTMVPKYNELTSNLDETFDLVVWPESATGRTLSTGLLFFDSIKTFSGSPLLFGSNTEMVDINHLQDKYFNSLYLISDENQLIDRYDKVKLLPFVEEMPMPLLGWIMRKLFSLHSFSSGDKSKILHVGKLDIAPNVCYEDIMPDFVRKSLKSSNKYDEQKANVIINCTNDSWFGLSSAPKMHMHISLFRAIENKRSLVRATCTGLSVICDPVGQIMYQTNLNEEDAFVQEVSLLDCDTIYNQGGWLFIYILTLLDFILLAYQFISRWIKKAQLQKLLQQKRHYEKLHQTWNE